MLKNKRTPLSLREWRKARGLNQHQAAAFFGVSQSAWAKIELGRRTPRRELALRLIRGTGIAAEILMRVTV